MYCGPPSKKLKEAARAIALGYVEREGETRGRFGQDVAAQLAAFNAPSHIIDIALGTGTPDLDNSGDADGSGEERELVFVLEAANKDALSLFIACQTQWRTVQLTTMSRAEIIRTGLDYVGVEAAARGLDLEWDEGLFDGLAIMEHATLELEREQRVKRSR